MDALGVYRGARRCCGGGGRVRPVPLFVKVLIALAVLAVLVLIFGGKAVGPFGTWGG